MNAKDCRGTEAARAPSGSAACKLLALRASEELVVCVLNVESVGVKVIHVQLQSNCISWMNRGLCLVKRIYWVPLKTNTQLSDEENLCILSHQTMDSSPASTIIQLHAYIHIHEVLLLIDSGSSTYFVDFQSSKKLSGILDLPKPCNVKITDGALLSCIRFISDCHWMSQGHEFDIDFRILSLGAYDAFLVLIG